MNNTKQGYGASGVLVGLGLLALVILAAFGGYAWYLRTWSFTKEVVVADPGPFYRMVVKLDYKGEPQVFDFVVACHVSRTFYQDNSSSYEPALVPAIYGHRMKDGKAVVIRPPVLCHGETNANKEVPAAFMPLVVVYENADTLEEGYAYMSDDAYASPLSDLKFGSTEVIVSNLEAFQVFMKDGVPNVVTRERYWSAQNDSIVKDKGFDLPSARYAKRCAFVSRWRLPERIRERARAHWPQNKPQFWYAQTWEKQAEIMLNVQNTNARDNEALWILPESGEGRSAHVGNFRHSDPNTGMARNKTPFKVSDYNPFNEKRDQPLNAYYPVWSEVRPSQWPRDKSKWPEFLSQMSKPVVRRIEMQDGKRRGFAACWTNPFLEIPEMRKFASKQGQTSVDGYVVTSWQGQEVQPYNGPSYLFERDEFALSFGDFDFGIPGGDVK